MIDPGLSLALSMHASPGIFAVLVGSGVSRGAGIMTGWEITLDLARRVATAIGEDAGRDPASWFTERFGQDPSYSALLGELAKSSAERQQMLRSYFEPNEDEREQGLKLPTPAHRGIARLAARGYVRLILTTNFDRLMELALEDEGVRPVVVASPDAIAGAPPLIHAPCTVVKVHGDYLDTRILNTDEELARYDRRLSRYLARVIDDFGWLVVGWSAEWDSALRGVFERSRGRRYSMYWAARGGELRDLARRLTDARGAVILAIKDADDLVTSLDERIQSIADSSAPDPMSLASAVAITKRYLAEPKFQIRLTDFVGSELERTWQAVGGEQLAFPSGAVIDDPTVRSLVKKAEAAAAVLCAIAATGTYWTSGEYIRIWIRAIERLANPTDPVRITFNSGYEPRLLPALFVMYAAGVGAVAGDRYSVLRAILLDPLVRQYESESPAVRTLSPAAVLNKAVASKIAGMERHKTPLSDELESYLRPLLRPIVSGEGEYVRAFDRFEYLLSLTSIVQ